MDRTRRKTGTCFIWVAAARQPSVIFIDEIDSLLTQRSSDENEASRRIKTEFLIQLDRAGSSEDEKILVLGRQTDPRSWMRQLDEDFKATVYTPTKCGCSGGIVKRLLTQNENKLSENDYLELVQLTNRVILVRI